MPVHHVRDGYAISTDLRYIDVQLVHRFLSESSYWAEGIPLDVVRRSLNASLCFGLYQGDPLIGTAKQVGFTRVVTDRATFAWICDVFVVEEDRGKGLGMWLMESVLAHADLQGLRQIVLATKDAHGLYAKLGFEPAPPGRFMAIRRPYR